MEKINIYLLVVGLFLIIYGFVGLFYDRIYIFTRIAPGVLLITASWILDKHRERREQEKKEKIPFRIEDISKNIESQPFVIRNVFAPFFVTLMVILGAFGLSSGILTQQLHWIHILSGCFLLCFAGIFYSTQMNGLFAAPVIFDKSGFETKLYGFVPWTEVQEIYLHETCTSHSILSIMHISVNRYFQIADKLHWIIRIQKMIRSRNGDVLELRINCANAKEEPKTIYAVARHLWHNATGLDTD